MNIALIGNSKFAHFWAKIISKMDNAKAYALYGSDEKRNGEAANEFGITKHSTNLEELLKDPEIDMAIITSVPSLHVPQSQIAIKAGKHVLVEKPPALSLKDFEETAKLAKDKNVKYAVDFMMRFDPFYKILDSVRNVNILGKLLKVEFVNMASDTTLPKGHWFWDKSQSGGIFIEHGVHFFDIYNHLLGKPEFLHSKTYSKPNDTGMEDHVYAALEYPGKIFASFTHIFNRPSIFEDNGSTLYFEKGKVRLDGWYAHTFNGEVILDESELIDLQKLIPDGTLSTEKIDGKITFGGTELKSPVKVKFTYELSRDEVVQDVYTEILNNFIKSAEKNLEPETSFERVKDALMIAEKCATEAS